MLDAADVYAVAAAAGHSYTARDWTAVPFPGLHHCLHQTATVFPLCPPFFHPLPAAASLASSSADRHTPIPIACTSGTDRAAQNPARQRDNEV